MSPPPPILSASDAFVVVTPRRCLNRPFVWRAGGSYLALAPRRPAASWNTHRDLGACFAFSSFSTDWDRSKARCFHTQSPVRRNVVVCSKFKMNGNEHTEPKEAPKPGNHNKRVPFQLDSRFSVLLSSLRNFSFQDFIQKVGLQLRKAIVPSLVAVLLGLCFLFLRLSSLPSPKGVPYSDFIRTLQEGTVSVVLFEEGSRRILFNTVSDDESESASAPEMLREVAQTDVAKVSTNKKDKFMPQWMYSTRKIENDETFLLSLLREKGTTFSSGPESALMSIRKTMVTILSLWIPLTPLMWLLHRQLSSTNSPAKKRRPTNQMISFGDVEGVDAAKAELMEIVSCLQGSINYSKLGAKLPRGVLLVGPPGTGKTLLARAVAGEAGVPFFSVSASEFVELFVGRGAARIRDLFNVARKCAPSIVFIDELDAVGGRRGRSFNDERDQTLNQLLTEMDGFESDMKVIVIAATNRPESLDPALCRPGRFSRRVLVGEPDFDGRRKILSVHIRGIPLEEDPEIICDLVATLTPGFAGADLANIVNEAALLAARRGSENVSREDIMMAIERAKFGINEQGSITKKLGKLFPWMPNLARRDENRENGLQGLMGYQILS